MIHIRLQLHYSLCAAFRAIFPRGLCIVKMITSTHRNSNGKIAWIFADARIGSQFSQTACLPYKPFYRTQHFSLQSENSKICLSKQLRAIGLWSWDPMSLLAKKNL